jgi:hypothetical protein
MGLYDFDQWKLLALIVGLCYITGCFVCTTTKIQSTAVDGRRGEYTRRSLEFRKGPIHFVIGAFVGNGRWLEEEV